MNIDDNATRNRCEAHKYNKGGIFDNFSARKREREVPPTELWLEKPATARARTGNGLGRLPAKEGKAADIHTQTVAAAPPSRPRMTSALSLLTGVSISKSHTSPFLYLFIVTVRSFCPCRKMQPFTSHSLQLTLLLLLSQLSPWRKPSFFLYGARCLWPAKVPKSSSFGAKRQIAGKRQHLHRRQEWNRQIKIQPLFEN